MKQFQFPRSRIIPPESRKTAATLPEAEPVRDEHYLQEFQLLLERSLREGLVLRIISASGSGKITTTGMITHTDPNSGRLQVQTLEGTRTIHTANILDLLT
ncbi:MAG: hypothetical protein SCK29_01345 [Bacillota bacterium]|nr:hypothetical protein [Bacillota bacterium]MDW7682745.1 hypothetical protein [Bacillota bacterium]